MIDRSTGRTGGPQLGISRRSALLTLAGGLVACGRFERTPPPLPRLEVPDGALVLREHFSFSNKRGPNSRFFIRVDGSYHAAHSGPLVIDQSRAFDDDPSLFWDTPFNGVPDAILGASSMDRLRAAIRATHFRFLAPRYTLPPWGKTPNHPVVDRWTVLDDGTRHTVVVEEEQAPAALYRLDKLIEALVQSAAPGRP